MFQWCTIATVTESIHRGPRCPLFPPSTLYSFPVFRLFSSELDIFIICPKYNNLNPVVCASSITCGLILFYNPFVCSLLQNRDWKASIFFLLLFQRPFCASEGKPLTSRIWSFLLFETPCLQSFHICFNHSDFKTLCSKRQHLCFRLYFANPDRKQLQRWMEALLLLIIIGRASFLAV